MKRQIINGMSSKEYYKKVNRIKRRRERKLELEKRKAAWDYQGPHRKHVRVIQEEISNRTFEDVY